MPKPNYTPEYKGIAKEELIKMRKNKLNPGLFHLYKDLLYIVDSHMQYMYDEKGKQYIDLFGGICTVSAGHCHPYVNEQMFKQLEKVQHTSTLYLTEPICRLADKITSLLPPGLDNVYFTNSGSEANELAMLMSQLYTGNNQFFALNNCYHGGGTTSSNLTSLRTWKYNVPRQIAVRHLQQPSPYRHQYPNDTSKETLTNYAIADLQNALDFDSCSNPALFLSEPSYQGIGGIVDTKGDGTYHQRVYEMIRKNGGLCLADEVQSAWGRLGSQYWGFENQNIKPDIVTVAKSIANGVPCAAVVTSREIGEVISRKLHFNTYGGNPLSAIAGLATIEAIEQDGLQQNCKVVGDHLINELKRLQNKHDIIGDVRGEGLMVGVEFVSCRESKLPATAQTAQVLEDLKDEGVLIGKGGLFGNILRVQPPMCLSKEDVDYTIQVLDHSLSNLKV